MQHGERLAVALCAIILASSATVRAGQLDDEELCRRRLDRMLAAQTSRLVKELTQCSREGDTPAQFEKRCSPRVGDDQNLHAVGARMDSGLTRVERHGDNKFPRKCAGMPLDFFAPACLGINDAAKQLRRCVYNVHTLPFLLDLIQITKNLPQVCRDQSLNQARLSWRDWISVNRKPTSKRRSRAIKRHCDGDIEHWATIGDSIVARSFELREITP